MDTFLIVLGALFLIAGLLGSFLPVLPGPPLSFLGLLTLRFLAVPVISDKSLFIWGLVAAFITVLDYFLPLWTTRRMGGSQMAMRGAAIGLFLGLFLGPVGVIIGPLVGAITGELLSGKPFERALSAGIGAFLGFVCGTVAKAVYALAAGIRFALLLF